MSTLGEYLKSKRNELGYSQNDVYLKTGVSNSRQSRIERDSNLTEASPVALKALAELYGINVVDLFLMAGFLDEKSLCAYEKVFRNVDLLDENEKNIIQSLIDAMTKGRGPYDF